MKGRYWAKEITLILVAAAISLATGKSVSAQRTTPASVERRIERMNRQLEQNERDSLGREKGNKTTNRAESLAKAEQVKKDFEELQADYNRIIVAMSDKQNADYNLIFRAVADINKRALRLKDNLALPKTKEEEENQNPDRETDSEPLEKSLLMLQKHIYSFITNPIFEAPAVLNVEKAEKASHDLEQIIEFSRNIGKKSN